MRYYGRARDLATLPSEGKTPQVLAEQWFEAMVGADGTIEGIAVSEPLLEPLLKLTGKSLPRGFRRVLAEVFPNVPEEPHPVQLALDDLPGASIVAGVAWSEFDPQWITKAFGDVPLAVLLGARKDACIGHAVGSSAQDLDDTRRDDFRPPAVSLLRDDDPEGWHSMELQTGVGFRRMRRIDVSVGEDVEIDAEFQDSAARPQGGRVAVHEYGLQLTANRATLEISTISATPRVLPYVECPTAQDNLVRLIGGNLADLRQAVPAALAGPLGCTHLNDTLRQLADVPALLKHLSWRAV